MHIRPDKSKAPFAYAALAAVVVGASMGYFIVERRHDAVPGAPRRADSGATAGELNPSPARVAPPLAVGSAPTASAAAPAMLSQRFASQFKQTRNLTQLIQDGLNDPSHGGYFYAELAFRRCQAVGNLKVEPVAATDPTEVADAKARLLAEVARCDGVEGQYGAGGFQLYRQIKDTRNGHDPLLALVGGGTFKAASPDAVEATLQAAQATGDTNLMRIALLYDIDVVGPRWFEGAGLKYNPELATQAANVVACTIGHDCDQSIPVMARCAIVHDCASKDEATFTTAGYTKEQLDYYTRAVALISSKVAQR